MTPIEAIIFVKMSGMLLVSSSNLEKAFMLDQIKKQEDSISYEALVVDDLQRGQGFNIYSKSLVVWIMTLETNKPKLMDIQSTSQCNMIVWTMQNTFGTKISKVMK